MQDFLNRVSVSVQALQSPPWLCTCTDPTLTESYLICASLL